MYIRGYIKLFHNLKNKLLNVCKGGPGFQGNPIASSYAQQKQRWDNEHIPIT